MFNLYRWPLISWWSHQGSHLGWEIIYHFGKHGLYSSSLIQQSSHQAACWHMLWWWQSHPMGSTLHFLSLPYGCYPLPQHVAWSPDHWWTPAIGDLSCLPFSGPMSGLWKLHLQIYNELRTSVISLTNHITKYQQSVPDEWHSSILQLPPIKWIQQVLDQLHSVQMFFYHIEFVVQDLQRMWLHVWGILDYMEIINLTWMAMLLQVKV